MASKLALTSNLSVRLIHGRSLERSNAPHAFAVTPVQSASASVKNLRKSTLVRSTEDASAASNDISDLVDAGASPMDAVGPRDDDILPDSLEDSIVKAAEACAEAIRDGNSRCIVEILVPEFWDPVSGALFKEEGDQLRWWRLTRRFTDSLMEEMPGLRVRTLYPDMGVAAMLANEWPDRGFEVSSLTETAEATKPSPKDSWGDWLALGDICPLKEMGTSCWHIADRVAIKEDDELVVLAAPDPPTLNDCKRVEDAAGPARPLVMFNPRLSSGDVGAGLSFRRIREEFLGPFQVVYSICPVGDIGSVFKRYGQQWTVFVEDEATPGRYRVAAKRDSRPAGEELDRIVSVALGLEPDEDGEGPQSLQGQVLGAMREMQRFMKQLRGI